MCGIVGFTLHSTISGGMTAGALDPLLNAIFSRGPDGEGRYVTDQLVMGMRRLSIIDLTGGWQPLLSRNGRVVAFQNGEIYNYQELRVELEARGYAFKSHSDTEVIAHGYDAYGLEGLLARLDGMFAIAIFDRDQNKLHIARDRLGEKPLYFSHAPGRAFSYGSSLLQLASLPWIEDTPDPYALDRYVAMHFCPGERTLFNQIRRVLPGEALTVNLDNLSLQRVRYWQPKLGEQRAMEADELRELIDRAVTSRMVADVPVGVFLSGGLDSSIVAAIAAQHNSNIDTFSMGFDQPEVDESEHARAVAKAIGSRHHEFQFDLNQFSTLLPEVASALDEPVGDQAMLPVYWLAKEARKNVTVVLAGEGADEVFGGYGYYKSAIAKAARRGAARTSAEGLVSEEDATLQSGFPILSGFAERRQLILPSLPTEMDPWEVEFSEWLDGARTPLQKASASDLATWLSDDLLVKFDRMAMAHSLEGRAPFLCPKLLQAGLNLPDKAKMTKDVSKVLLREAANDLMPADLLARRKQGFVLPMKSWLREWFDMHGGPAGFFEQNEMPGLDPQVAARIAMIDIAQGLNRERLLFALVLIHQWWTGFAQRRRSLRSLIAAA